MDPQKSFAVCVVRIWCCVACFLIPGTVVQAEETGSFEELKKAHAEAMGSIKAKCDEQLFRLKVGYEGALKKLRTEAGERGDLNAALAVREEQESFGSEPLSRAEMEALRPEIAALRKKYDAALVANSERTSDAQKKLVEGYAAKLVSLQRELTKAGRLDAASAVAEAHAAACGQLSVSVEPPAGYDLFLSFDTRPKDGGSPEDLSPSEINIVSEVEGWVASGHRAGGYQIARGGQRLVVDTKTPFPLEAMTIAAWVRLDKYGHYSRLWHQYYHDGKKGYACCIDQGRPVFVYWDEDSKERKCQAPKAEPIPLNEWHHLTYTFDSSSRCVVYVDGEQLAEADASPMRVSKMRPRVGANPHGGNPLRGTIDDLIHYSRALGREEVRALYKAVSNGSAK